METHLSELPILIYVHDHEVNLGSPEHLEVSAQRTPNTSRVDRSFEDFINALRSAIEEHGGQFGLLKSTAKFRAAFTPENQLRIDSDIGVALIDVDDLRSIWVKLLKGVVTARAADWGPSVTGEHILSLLSRRKTFESSRFSSRTAEQPEIAVELHRRDGIQLAEDIDFGRPELAWDNAATGQSSYRGMGSYSWCSSRCHTTPG